MATYFTADTHFGHDSIRRNCERPFATVNEMDAALTANWNAVVRSGDTVYHLGDFCFKSGKSPAAYIEALNGRIHLIRGNHDERTVRESAGLFESVSDICTIKIDGRQIVLCHYAMRVWNRSHRGAWHLYGHSHGRLPEIPGSLSFDTGVDSCGYYPISYARVEERMREKAEHFIAREGRHNLPCDEEDA